MGRHNKVKPHYMRRRLVAGGSFVAVVILAISASFALGGSKSHSHPQALASAHVPASASPSKSAAPSKSADHVLGPTGVESAAIIAENRKPGTTSWKIEVPASTPRTAMIEGWASLTYASVGDHLSLYVSTTAQTFHVVAYRMGWYAGTGAREVWSSAEVPGVRQAACPVQPGINMVSCDGWTPSLSMTITGAFMQGDYLLKLVGDDGSQSYVPLTVWDPSSTATYLFMNRSLTEQGWNAFGGFDYYTGHGPCAKGEPTYPVCNRARVVSFDRPYDTGNGSADFLDNEYPLLRYMEEQGLDVAYCSDITVNDHPMTLMQHKALLSLDHDETWTYSERRAAQAAEQQGINVAFFGAAAIVRHARLQASPIGPEREVVDYRNSAEDPLDHVKGQAMEVTGNTWSAPPTSWPTTGFVGEEYSGYLFPDVKPAPFVVHDASAWIFRGTGLDNGSVVPDMISSDIDHLARSVDVPSDLQVLGHSPVPLSEVQTSQGRWGGFTYSDMTYWTDAHGQAGIFDSGTVPFINTLSRCASAIDCPSAVTRKMTGNLLWLFGQGPAGAIVPSVPNWRSVVPAGS